MEQQAKICAQNGEGETHMVNLSSDTVTEPSKAMKEAMMSAPLGDDLGGVHPRTLRNLPDGTFSLTELRQLVRGVDDHWPTTALVCVENTQNMVGGRVLPLAWLDELGVLCRELELPLHMDGARLFNAAAALGVPPSRIVKDCASVSICLSKGLGAPALGGGMRQVGVLAAAGIYALDHVGPTLTRDHAYIQEVARAVVECKSEIIKCDPASAHTNILLLECDPEALPPSHLCERMDQVTDEEVAAIGERVVARILPITDTAVRMVVHCDITHEDIQSVINKLKYVIKEFDGKA
ncbi:low-specificity L-threonine aldolase 2-like 2 [Homarus americanus]|uniref:Low-specificity L-threonine aldolase 2-like 2 n=1 Tax=Homarus americanus TaxID=6706 RepID=A0A8J5MPT3_HOMAM|nr:low-specificity L-threonine aldolase 2-like 2 [Homarus americanus]